MKSFKSISSAFLILILAFPMMIDHIKIIEPEKKQEEPAAKSSTVENISSESPVTEGGTEEIAVGKVESPVTIAVFGGAALILSGIAVIIFLHSERKK